MAEVSPFPYQAPLEPAAVRGRDGLLAELVDRVTTRRVTAVVGPRRYGKTSLLRRLAADLTEVQTVWVDLYEVASAADLAVRLDRALAAADGPFGAQAQRTAAAVHLSLGVVRVDLARPARERPDPDVLFGTLLDVLVQTALRVPTLLVLDEFSSISRIDGAAGRLRTALQHHYADIGLVFAGSMPSVMRRLFTARIEPFYGQADLLEVGPLDGPDVVDLVADGFAATGRRAGATPSRVLAFAEGHPQRTMQVADACWQRTTPGAEADDEVWQQAVADLRHATADPMERLYAHFGPSERDVLRITANGGSVHGTAANLVGLGKSSAVHAQQRLLDDGDLIRRDGRPAVTDPLLAHWLRQVLPIP